MNPRRRKTRFRPPNSIAARGTLVLLLAAASVGLPLAFSAQLLSSAAAARRDAADGAMLAVALRAYLTASPDRASAWSEWVERVAEDNARVRWAGVFDRTQTGLEFRRRIAMPRDDILAQMDLDARQPAFKPFVLAGRPSDRFYLLSVPREDDVTLAAIVDLGEAAARPGPWVVAAAAVGLLGLVFSFVLLHRLIVAPIRCASRAASTLESDLARTALGESMPRELIELIEATERAQQDLQRWEAEVRELRESMDETVAARTRHAEREVRVAQRDADADALTGLHNRRYMRARLPELFEAQRRSGDDLTVVVVDIDNFKELNDALGHNAGDDLLAFAGRLIRASVRRGSDLAVRYGGDEFVLALPGTPLRDAQAIADRITALFGQHVHTLPPVEPRAGISAGLASLRTHRSRDCDALLKAADQAMYRVKRSSKAQRR